MKKKILFGLGAFALAAVLTLNVSLTKNENNFGLSLNSIETVSQAQAEGSYSGNWIVTIYSTSHWICNSGGGVCCPGWDC